jgi:hypothetical protein
MTIEKSTLVAGALLAFIACNALGCDEKKGTPPSASASATASAAPSTTATTATTTTTTATASASAKPAASAQTSTKDPTVSVLDPTSEPEHTVKAQAGGNVTQQETLPGFAGPGTPGASFVWSLKDPSLKPGQTLKVKLENKGSDKAAAPTPFTLTIEIVAS